MTALERYVYEEIVPRYADFDKAHKEEHALTVISQALKLLNDREVWLETHPEETTSLWNVPIDRDILLAAAACHDLGLINGRDNHHIDSGMIIRHDRRLRELFLAYLYDDLTYHRRGQFTSSRFGKHSILEMSVIQAWLRLARKRKDHMGHYIAALDFRILEDGITIPVSAFPDSEIHEFLLNSIITIHRADHILDLNAIGSDILNS